jgi:hypothetical protein
MILQVQTKPSRKRIFIHIGLPKTGSSALQAFLSHNADRLERLGFSYPFPEAAATVTSGTCSGNLLHVMPARAKTDGAAVNVPEMLELYLPQVVDDAIVESRCNTVILSGEFIGANLVQDTVRYFCRLSERHHVTFLGFVRDVYDMMLSGWKQRVKTGIKVDLPERITMMSEAGLFSVTKVAMLINAGLDVRLRNYDIHRRDVIGAFAGEIGLDLVAADLTGQDLGLKNPSLSFWQAKAVLLALRTAPSKLAAALVDRFLKAPDGRCDPYLAAVDAQLLHLLRDDIALLNLHLPPGEALRAQPRPIRDEADQGFPADIVETVMRAMQDFRAADQVPQTAPTLPGLPPDFDPETYLMWNRDVAAAGVDPAYHYLHYGRFEARRYR